MGAVVVMSVTQLFSLYNSFGWSRAGCNVSVYLYSVSVCIRPVYPLLTTFFYFDPPSVMYTYHDDNDVFKKISLSLFQRYQSTSHCLEMTTIQKKDKKKVNVHIKG